MERQVAPFQEAEKKGKPEEADLAQDRRCFGRNADEAFVGPDEISPGVGDIENVPPSWLGEQRGLQRIAGAGRPMHESLSARLNEVTVDPDLDGGAGTVTGSPEWERAVQGESENCARPGRARRSQKVSKKAWTAQRS
jgi:hypothetical protein